MAGNVKPVPEGTHTLTVHLMVREGTKAVEFYQKALGAKLLHVHNTPDGKVMHASMQIGDSQFALADEFPGMSLPAPQTLGGSPVVMNLYVEDVDALFNQAIAARSNGADAFGQSILGRSLRSNYGSLSATRGR